MEDIERDILAGWMLIAAFLCVFWGGLSYLVWLGFQQMGMG